MKHRILRLAAIACALTLLIGAVPFSAAAAGGNRTIARMPAAPTIDGVITETEWGAPTMELQNYQMATIPGGAEKVALAGDVYLSYDATHFYLAIVAEYADHKNTATDYDLWQGDAMQMQIAADGNDRRSFCFGLGSDGVSRGYQSGNHRETYATTETGGEFFVTRDEESDTTVYEIALPLSRFSDNVSALTEGNTIAFSFAMHMHNGYYYEWCGGIALEKNINQAATLTLGAERADTEPTPDPEPEPKPDPEPEPEPEPEPTGRTVRVGDVDKNEKVNTTDARLTLQYAASRIDATALDLDAAEVNGDQKTNTTDARLILQFAAGRIDAFPRGEFVTIFDEEIPGEDETPGEGETPGEDEEVPGEDETPGEDDAPVETTGKTVSSNTFSPVSDAAGTPFAALSDGEFSGGGAFNYFTFTTDANEALPFNVACSFNGNTVTAMLPAGIDLSALIPTFSCASGTEVTANGAPLISDVTVLDATGDVTITAGGSTYTLRVETLDTGLPSVAMTTEGYTEITSKEEYLAATIYLGGDGEEASIRTAKVKGRGNSSWKQPKKGYTIKLDQKETLLGMSESKDWALISNYEDNTLLRNTMAQYLAEGAGIEYVMKNRSVDLWYNGEYWGTYTLTEKIEIEKDRVNITKYEPGCAVGDTGFLTEFDGHVTEIPDEQRAAWTRPLGNNYELYYDPATDEVFMPISIGGKWLTIKKPSYKTLTENNDLKQLGYIYDKVRAAVDALWSGDYNRIAQCIDVRSFAKWYLVQEYMNNGDSSFHSSCYMALDVNGKLKLGPAWDFDRSSANCDYWNPNEDIDSLYNSGAAWFQLLFRCDQARAILKQEYTSFRTVLETLPDYLETMADSIHASQIYNFEKWQTLDIVVDDFIDQAPNRITTLQQNSQTFEAEIDVLEDYFLRRTAQMDAFIPNL